MTTCVLDTGSDAIVFPKETREWILKEFFPWVTPKEFGREEFDCLQFEGTNFPFARRIVRLYLNGFQIDWDLQKLVRYGPNHQCYLLLATGVTDDECDLSSNFLLAAYGECAPISMNSGTRLDFPWRILYLQKLTGSIYSCLRRRAGQHVSLQPQ
jgi:hypothetical protein